MLQVKVMLGSNMSQVSWRVKPIAKSSLADGRPEKPFAEVN